MKTDYVHLFKNPWTAYILKWTISAPFRLLPVWAYAFFGSFFCIRSLSLRNLWLVCRLLQSEPNLLRPIDIFLVQTIVACLGLSAQKPHFPNSAEKHVGSFRSKTIWAENIIGSNTGFLDLSLSIKICKVISRDNSSHFSKANIKDVFFSSHFSFLQKKMFVFHLEKHFRISGWVFFPFVIFFFKIARKDVVFLIFIEEYWNQDEKTHLVSQKSRRRWIGRYRWFS